MQWQCLSMPTDPTGQSVMHDTTVSTVCARWLARYSGDTIAPVPYVDVCTGKAETKEHAYAVGAPLLGPEGVA